MAENDTGKLLADSAKIFSLAKRRGFMWPAFEIYGGSAGFYDYAPLGTALKQNILDVWRRYYLLGEGFHEIDSPNISPEPVFEASGHLTEFTDFLTSCNECGESFRADHLLEGKVDNPDGLTRIQMDTALTEHKIKCLRCGGAISPVEPFNLMFSTNVGPGSKRRGYMRPETAQGIFINFANLYRYSRDKLPLGIIQVGKGFRNEISPRNGLLRQREFNMAEVEVFFDPQAKTWPRFEEMADDVLLLVPDSAEPCSMTARDAVAKSIVLNEPLAYFMALTKRFLVDIGLREDLIRFRQHESNEMAHYASDCWDAEALLSYGWTEIVGIADRGDFDVSRHVEMSGADLKAFRPYNEPKQMDVEFIEGDAKKMGPVFRGDAKKIMELLPTVPASQVKEDGTLELTLDDKTVVLETDMFTVKKETRTVSGENFIPHVVEPSYGVDRIFYAALEHSYYEREGEGYRVLKLPSAVAPIHIGVFPLMAKDGLDDISAEIDSKLRTAGIRTYHDDSGTVGRRYARMDEIGTPFCITVDYETKDDKAVTVRERDTMEQKRIPITELALILPELVSGSKKFAEL